MPVSLVNYLKKELNFANREFIIKKNVGRNTFGTELDIILDGMPVKNIPYGN